MKKDIMKEFEKENRILNNFSFNDKFADIVLKRIGFMGGVKPIIGITCNYNDDNFNLFYLLLSFRAFNKVPDDCKNLFNSFLN